MLKIALISLAIAATGILNFNLVLGSHDLAYSSILPRENTIVASVWDKETATNDSGITEMTVYRSPTCSCCGAWIDHAENQGFQVVQDLQTEAMAEIKEKLNIPPELASCHTAIIDGYVMEGHVPADDIKRFLTEKPQDLIGLTVPEMPVGTPGMESGDTKDPFQVLAFNSKGEVQVFNDYQSY